jgi:hypothetical protein
MITFVQDNAEPSQPLVWCGCSFDQIGDSIPNLIVFPEGVSNGDMERTKARIPDAVVAGAILEDGRMRGVLSHRGENLIDYLKAGCDGRSKGGLAPEQTPIAEVGDLAVGLLICMDVQDSVFAKRVLDDLEASAATFKVLCIPADMNLDWSFEGSAPFMSRGQIHVVLSNNTKTYPDNRIRSFITNRAGAMRKVQVDKEAITERLQFRASGETHAP